jgi:Tfp pilus assembly protein PilN
VTTKKGQVEDLRAELAGYEAAADDGALDDKSAGLTAERQSRRAAFATALGGRLAWDRLMRELALVIPDNVAVTAIIGTAPVASAAAPGAPGTNFTIRGETEEQEDVAKLLSRLAVIPELEAITLIAAARNTNEDGDEVIGFEIKATTRGGVL